MAKSKLKKPERKVFESAYEWNAVQEYIEKKYGVELRGYKRNVDGHDDKYRDFWHWLLDRTSISNGTFFYLPEDYGDADWWQIEIMKMILKEFPELATERIWVSW
jgi:hypothetical protein